MTQYAFLLLPAANAVYRHAASQLALAEFQVLASTILAGRIEDIAFENIAGIAYLGFTAPDLTERELGVIARLSGLYALFERRDNALVPIALPVIEHFSDDLITIQKYPGKTNPSFTKLLLNVTLFSTPFATDDRRLNVFDPLCGRGTTLNQALMHGYDCAGMEIDDKDFDAYARFLEQWLKDNRVKHEIVTAKAKQAGSRRLTARIGLSKEAYKAGDAVKLEVVNGDTLHALTHFKPESFDVIVTDLPYGVLHGSRSSGGESRRPADLCAEALPGWIRLLRPGGAIGLSWNTRVTGREKFRQIVADSGLRVLTDGPYGDFRHEVDQSITRDLVVAVKG